MLPLFGHGADMPWTHVGLIVLVGALGTIGHFLFILAFQRAPASALTPFTYMQLVWAMLLGWLRVRPVSGPLHVRRHRRHRRQRSAARLARAARGRGDVVEEPTAVD